MSQPQVPPRPARSNQPYQDPQPAGGPTSAVPQVPPRPAGRRADRSPSPSRYAPSPLNDVPFGVSGTGAAYGANRQHGSTSTVDHPARPPSVSLPSIGQEGSEYADMHLQESQNDLHKTTSASSSHKTTLVGRDLPLHAPKPTLSQSDAKARVSAVTRTDSSHALAAGIDKLMSPPAEDKDPYGRPLKAKTSSILRSSSAMSTERPDSALQTDEVGIPQIGQHVPMLPNAGDVQAPSPAPGPQFPSGIGFHNDGTKPRHHGRKHSAKDVFHGPPGSYGLHGHGVGATDKFEKDWYDKHPDAVAREENGQYSPALGTNRAEWAMSSEDLNKIVKETATRGAGFGTSKNVVGLPNEQVGYRASEEYANKMRSSRPQSATYGNKAHSNHSQTHVESPLREASFPANVMDKFDKPRTLHNQSSSEQVMESENEDDGVHIDPPEERRSKFTKEGPGLTEDLGPRGGNTGHGGGFIEERGYGVPILASDELTPGQEFLLPAVSPAQYIPEDMSHMYRTSSAGSSRPGSRPGSIHGLPALSRFISHDDEGMHTPLEDVREYEPLFAEDDDGSKKPMTPADRMKQRPDMKRRFPSQDIWEDAPPSVQLQTEVETPEPERQVPRAADGISTAFETPDDEAARKGEVSEAERAKLLPKEERLAKSNFKVHLRDESDRPGVPKRFPSRDIWEDSPDHAQLETTIGGGDNNKDGSTSPDDAGLAAGAVVRTRELSREGATAGQPGVPPRPSKSRLSEQTSSGTSPDIKAKSPTDARKPAMPGRPKPQVPVRPNKQSSRDSVESPLTKSISATSGGSNEDASVKSPPISTKSKPNVPARPSGSKIAALQAGFMSDLNNRLKVGPQPPAKPQDPAEEQQEEEKAPLVDARKGRAKGPARRKPASSPGVKAVSSSSASTLEITEAWTVWSTSRDGIVGIPGETSTDADVKAAEESSSGAVASFGVDADVSSPSEAAFENEPEAVPSVGTIDHASEDIAQVALPEVEAAGAPEISETDRADEDDEADDAASEPVHQIVQTGEKTIVMPSTAGEPVQLTVTEGGNVQEEGHVVQKEEGSS